MTTSRGLVFACQQCRDKRRKCDKERPMCAFCTARNIECIYPSPTSDGPPPPLVQELSSIRERLDRIRDTLNSTHSRPQFLPDPLTLAACNTPGIPALGINSPSLMQIVGLKPNLPSLLYQLERPSQDHGGVSRKGEFFDLSEEASSILLQCFHDQVQLCYPVLHSGFTEEFFAAQSHGFPCSTSSCLALLVVSVSYLLLNPYSGSPSYHFDNACSMLAVVLQEDGVTSVQCLILFSIYYLCLARPIQAHRYLQLALLRIQSLLRRQLNRATSPDRQLTNRLYWVIFMIRSEISPHLNLSSAGRQNPNASIPLPEDHEAIWVFPATASSPPDAYTRNGQVSCFRMELELQQFLDWGHTKTLQGTTIGDRGQLLVEWFSSLPDTLRSSLFTNPDIHNPSAKQVLLTQAKYHLYEITLYWPAVYHIIATGRPKRDLLPYGPLLFESIVSFLTAATAVIPLYPAKSWPLCASVFTVSLVALRMIETPLLSNLIHPNSTSSLTNALTELQHVSELSPSVENMRWVLEERLSQANII